MGFVEEITEVDIETTVGIEYDDRPDADQSTSSAADESAHDDLATGTVFVVVVQVASLFIL